MTDKKPGFDWGLLFFWLVATTMGWFLGRVLLPNLILVVTGALIGGFQWLSLTNRFPRAWRWAIGTLVGWLIGGSIIILLVPTELEPFLVGPVLGLTTGIGQWVVLRQYVSWSGWWPLVSAAGWTAGFSLIPGMINTGVVAALITGIALELLLRYPKPRPEIVGRKEVS